MSPTIKSWLYILSYFAQLANVCPIYSSSYALFSEPAEEEESLPDEFLDSHDAEFVSDHLSGFEDG